MTVSRLLCAFVAAVLLLLPLQLILRAQSFTDSAGCFNNSAYTAFDSSVGMYSFIRYETSGSSMSPDRRQLATWLRTENYPSTGIFLDVVAIIDVQSSSIRRMITGAWLPKWSPNGTRLLMVDAIYFPDGDSIAPLPRLPNGFTMFRPEWSADGAHVYCSTPNALYRCDQDGRNVEFVGAYPYGCLPWTLDTVFCEHPTYNPNLYCVYDIRSGKSDTVWTPEWYSILTFAQIAFSPNRRFFAADASYVGPITEPRRTGLCMYDFATHRLKELLGGQPFRIPYYPSWSSDSTLLISFVCHLDSSYTTWEIDTNGVFLRRLTAKTILPGLTGIGATNVRNAMYGMKIYPAPATASSTMELDILLCDTYSITIFDAMGRECGALRKQMRLEAGRQTLPLPLGSLAPGFYILRLKGSSTVPVHVSFVVRR